MINEKLSKLFEALFLLSLCYSSVTGQQTVSAAVGGTAQLACQPDDNAIVSTIELSSLDNRLIHFSNAPDNSDTIIEYHDGKYSLDTDTWTVSITNVQISDEGEYNCKVQDITGVMGENLHILRVYDPPSTSLISAPDLIGNPPKVVEGSTVNISCRINTVSPTDNLSFSLKSSSTVTVVDSKLASNVAGSSAVTATFNNVVILIQHGQPDSQLYCELLGYSALDGIDYQQLYQYLNIAVCQKATITSDSSTPVNAGVSVSITCSAVCSQTQSVTLYKGSGSDVTAIGSDSGSHSVTLTRQDNGVPFYCDIPGWPSGVKSNSIYFTVHFPPEENDLTLTPSNSVVAGETQTLTCVTGSVNPASRLIIRWKRNNDEESESDSSDFTTSPGSDGGVDVTSIYTFIAAKSDNGATFSCTPVWDGQEISSLQRSRDVNVHFQPTQNHLTVSPANSIIEGETQTLTCVVGSVNPASRLIIRWKRDNAVIPESDSSDFTTSSGSDGGVDVTSTYTFTAAKSDNGATFSCTPVWDGQEISSLKDSINLVVYYPPMVSLSLGGSSFINAGLNRTLTCDASDGNPNSYTYQWRFQPKFSSAEFQLLPDEASDTLELTSVTRSSAGQYRCDVSNTAGSDSGDVTLKVNYVPVPFGPFTFHGRPGTQITGYIQVTSYPPARVDSWPNALTHDNTEMVNDTTRFTFTVRVQDESSYEITIKNGGNRQITVTVYIIPQGKPSPAENIMAVSVSHRQIIVSFTPGLDGGFSQTITCQVTESGSDNFRAASSHQYPLRSYDVTELIATDLSAETTYSIRLQSDNQYQDDEAVNSIVISVTTRELIPLEENFVGARSSGSSIRLSWSIPDQFHTALLVEQCVDEPYCSLRHNVTDREEFTVNKTDGTELALLVMQDRDEVIRVPFQTQADGDSEGSDPPGLPIATVAGGVVGGLIVIALITAVLVIVVRRKDLNKRKYIKEDVPRTREDDEAEPNTNADGPVYAQVVKKPKKSTSQPTGSEEKTGLIYANVQQKPKTAAKPTGTAPTAIYSEVQKKPKAAPSTGADIGIELSNQAYQDQNLYANVESVGAPLPSTDSTHAQQQQTQAMTEKDLIYADLSFRGGDGKPSHVATSDVIHGLDDAVVYGEVDFTKHADPLPDSESDDEEDIAARQ